MFKVFTTAAAVVLLAGAALAQDTNQSANSAAAANAQVRASATGDQANTQGVTVNLDQSNRSNTSRIITEQDGEIRSRIENTPDAYAPAVPGGNPCVVGASAGASLPGFGISGGGAWTDKQCEVRQQASMLYNMGFKAEAIALMCQQNDALAEAFIRTGKCRVEDKAAAAPAAAAAAPAAPAAVCHVKPGTTRTVVTNATTQQGRMACAASLGLL